MTKFRFLTTSLPAIALVSALLGCSSTGPKPLTAKERGTPELNTALMRVNLNGAERPIVIELYPEAAPKTVANFKQKSLDGYFDGMAFHRVITRYIVQSGDPLSKDDDLRDDWGTGGNEDTLPAEIKLKHQRGSIAMARLGNSQNPSKRSSASQFYITLTPQKRLDGQYTVFGQVVQGMEVVDEMAKSVVDSNDNPIRRIEITSVSLIPADADVEDKGASKGVGDRRNTIPQSQKGPLTRFIERIW